MCISLSQAMTPSSAHIYIPYFLVFVVLKKHSFLSEDKFVSRSNWTEIRIQLQCTKSLEIRNIQAVEGSFT